MRGVHQERPFSRILPTERIFNVRELGGYALKNGKHLRRGLLYRSGELYAMTENDKRLLESNHIKTIVDFRAAEERLAAPDRALGTVEKRLELPIDAGNLMELARTTEGAEAEMKKLYAALPVEAAPRYRELFRLISGPSNTPLLFHCSAGKDRTGLAAALILHTLGAETDAIFEDYMESARLLEGRLSALLEGKPYMKPYATVQKSYLEIAFGRIEKLGGIDRYIREDLGADTGLLRRLYTE